MTAGRTPTLPIALGCAALLAGTAPAQAATIAITLGIPSYAQISGLSDVNFSNVPLTTDAVNTQNVCVFSNSPTRSYSVVASGSGTGSSFRLANPQGATVPYSVGWAGAASSASTTNLTTGTPSALFSGASILINCLGTSLTSTLKVSISTSDLQTMVGGTTYSGTLTLVITPG